MTKENKTKKKEITEKLLKGITMFKTEYKEVKGDVTTKVVDLYLKDMGYRVDQNYVVSVRKGEKYILSIDIVSIFNKYDSGFPDFLIEKNGKIEFVKYRYNNVLTHEQYRVLNELSKYINVTLIFFLKETLNVGTHFEEQLDIFYNTSKVKRFKPLWVAAELYKKFGTELFDRENMTALSKKIGIKEDKIRYFLSNNIDRKEIKKIIKKLVV